MSNRFFRPPLAIAPALVLATALAGCGKPQAAAPAVVQLPPPREPTPSMRRAIQLVATRVYYAQAPAAPLVVEPHHDLYDDQPAPAASPPPDTPGFRLTVPVCRRAERMNDPLAKTAECAQLIQAAKDQAEACKKAFEAGDDKAALSPACRQAAGFR